MLALHALVAAALSLTSSVAAAPDAMPSMPVLVSRAEAYGNPLEDGGSMLTVVNNTYPPGLGEPLNVILSADSDPVVLVDSLEKGGFQNYMLATNLSGECLGASFGSKQLADLGDGKGNVSQTQMLRWNFGDQYVGSCRETFEGGLHLRYWVQNSTGAFFMAASVEMDLDKQHDIVPNGYNLGRDYLAGNITKQDVHSRNLTNTSTFEGQSSFNNYTYHTSVKFVSGMLKNSSDDINHHVTVEADGYPAIDGLVAVLTVKVLEYPPGSGALRSIPMMSGPPIIMSVILAAIASIL